MVYCLNAKEVKEYILYWNSSWLIVIINVYITNDQLVAKYKEMFSKKTTIVVASKNILYVTKLLSETLSDCERYVWQWYILKQKTSDINWVLVIYRIAQL